MLDGFPLDTLALQQNGLRPAEIDISWGQIVQALVVPPVVIHRAYALTKAVNSSRATWISGPMRMA